jgi:predicted permease
MSPAAARAAAHRGFGNVTSARERFYESRRVIWLDHLLQDLRGAVRSIRRYPVAAAVAVISLAAGIGATSVTLSIRDMVFYKPPPLYEQPEQLSRVQVGRADRPIRPFGSNVPSPLYAIWSDRLGSAIAAAAPRPSVRNVRTSDRTDTVPVRAVTPEFFPVLGVRPKLGQTFADAAATGTSDQQSAVLSHRLWYQLFDGRPDAIGGVVWIDNRPHTVIGVMPERFWFSDMDSPIWTALDRRTLAPDDALEVIVRRRSDVTPAMLESQLRGGLDQYARQQPEAQRRFQLKTSGIEGTPLGRSMSVVLPYILATSVLLTLLIACANVAILMIAQWTGRRHEIAIRASIGASRSRIVRSLLTESVLIAASGGVLGACAALLLRAVVLQQGGETQFFDMSLDPRIFLQTAAITLFAGIAAGVAPALYETRRLHSNPLTAIATSDLRQRWRHGLVILEITITVALLVETVALIDGYQRARTADMGFRARPLMTVRVESPLGVPTAQILELLNRLPGVVGAGASTVVPYAGGGQQERVATDATGSNAVLAERGSITSSFFSALDVPLRAGRAFTDRDTDATRTVIINEGLARRLFPASDPIGSRVWMAQTPYEIVGVVADYSNRPLLGPAGFAPKVFQPLPAVVTGARSVQFLVRAEGDPAPLVQTVRRGVLESIPGSSVTSAFTFDQIVNVIAQEILVGTAPLFPLIVIGMLLTTAGVYGVLAFAITRRSRELAVRVAIGARRSDLVRLVAWHAARLVLIGTAAGTAATFGLARLVRASGGAGSIFDPALYVFVFPILIVLVIGVLATWIPARRALRINPASLLRIT